MVDSTALVEALQARKQVQLSYQKATTGEIVEHQGGIQEIGANSRGTEVLWLWDTQYNDHIRQFILANILSFQVLDLDYIPPQPWDFKLNGQIL